MYIHIMWQILHRVIHQGNDIDVLAFIHLFSIHSFIQETFIELLWYAFTVLGKEVIVKNKRNSLAGGEKNTLKIHIFSGSGG